MGYHEINYTGRQTSKFADKHPCKDGFSHLRDKILILKGLISILILHIGRFMKAILTLLMLVVAFISFVSIGASIFGLGLGIIFTIPALGLIAFVLNKPIEKLTGMPIYKEDKSDE
jgi:hypothetical protein